MGVKYLNGYFTYNCSKNAIYKTNIEQWKDKTIVVDTSIYLYKFLTDGSFIEQLYLFLSIFKYYHINAVFIFDGKPPPEKWPLLRQRYEDKKRAQDKYDELQNTLTDLSGNSYESTVVQLNELRKKMVKIRPDNIQDAKNLMTAFGFVYLEAPCEADILCAFMVNRGYAWACLSEDMDMFLLGCPRILRNMSLLGHTWTVYHTDMILKELELTLKELVEIIVLSGSDYTIGTKKPIKYILDTYRNTDTHISMETVYDFYKKLYSCESIIPIETFNKYCSLFEINHLNELLEPILNIYTEQLAHVKMNIKEIYNLMEPHGFIFLH